MDEASHLQISIVFNGWAVRSPKKIFGMKLVLFETTSSGASLKFAGLGSCCTLHQMAMLRKWNGIRHEPIYFRETKLALGPNLRRLIFPICKEPMVILKQDLKFQAHHTIHKQFRRCRTETFSIHNFLILFKILSNFKVYKLFKSICLVPWPKLSLFYSSVMETSRIGGGNLWRALFNN